MKLLHSALHTSMFSRQRNTYLHIITTIIIAVITIIIMMVIIMIIIIE